MTPFEHATQVGQLISNFQCLETWLRVALLKHESVQHAFAETDFEEFLVGKSVAENHLTDYAQLRVLISRFNEGMSRKRGRTLNVALADIRDALAHGRVVGTASGFPLRLVKFSRPKSARVTVVFNEVMDHNWFNLQIMRTHLAIELVRAEV